MKIKGDPILKDLRIRRKKCKRFGRSQELSDVYLEMGDHLRQLFRRKNGKDPELLDKAISKYKNSIEKSKFVDGHTNSSLAYRALAEIALEKDDTEGAISNIENAIRYALRAKNHSFVQLCYHQCAMIYASTSTLPEKAVEIAKAGLKYLQENAEQINRVSCEGEGDSSRRKAGMENLLAGIFIDLSDFEQARLYNERCLDYSSEHSDFDLHYRALYNKLRLTSGQERLDVAREMERTAMKVKLEQNPSVRYEAQFYVAVELLRFNFLEKSKLALWRLHSLHLDHLPEIERKLVGQYLLFVFKTEKRIERAAECTDEGLKSQIYEKIADDAAAEELQLLELAMFYYNKMLAHSADMNQKRNALVSLGETANDLKDYSHALALYREVFEIERKMGLSEAKLLETEICIVNVSLNVEAIPTDERSRIFQEVYRKCFTDSQKESLLIGYIKFLGEHGAADGELEKWNLVLNKLLTNKNSDSQGMNTQDSAISLVEDNDTLAKTDYTDEFDIMSEMEIFTRLKDEIKVLEDEQKISREVDAKVNNNGETRLHLAAKTDSYDMLKKLIEKGYNVNAVDNGGWTPLSEAVSHNQLRNVRLLLERGARVDCRSRECSVNDEGEQISGSGQTPLMEACANGNVKIAKILIHFKANVIQRDDDGWTCVDYLKEYIRANSDSLSAKDLGELSSFVTFLECRQKKCGLSPRKSPPPKRQPSRTLKSLKKKIGRDREHLVNDENEEIVIGSDDDLETLLEVASGSKTKKRAAVSDEAKNLEEYRRMISSLGRKRTANDAAIVGPRRQFATSVADEIDQRNLNVYNELDSMNEALPADRRFLAPEDDDLGPDERNTSKGIADDDDDEDFASIHAKRMRRRQKLHNTVTSMCDKASNSLHSDDDDW